MTQTDAPSPAGPNTPPADTILTALAIGLAAFAVLFVLAFVSQNQTQAQALQRIEATRPARLQSAGLLQALVDVETGQRGFLLTRDARFLEPYEIGRRDLARQVAALRDTASHSPDLLEPTNRASNSAETALSAIDHTLTLHHTHPLSDAEIASELLSSKSAMDIARTDARALAAEVERLIDIGRAQNAASRSAIYVLGALLGFLTIVAVVLTTWAIRQERRAWRTTIKALSDAREAAEVAHAKAAASDLAKTRFLATASHDMRQPLHAMTLYLSALNRRVQTQEAREIVKKMERAAESMAGMFATLLDLARIQAEVIEPEVSDFRLQDVIDGLIAEHPGADIVARYDIPSPSVHTDQMLLARLLRNLISNGLKHGGGSVRIVTTPVGGRLQISVIDRGFGIAPEDQSRVFDEFVRLEGKGASEGLGLGLAIVQRISELLGLQLSLQSAPQQGATFSIQVPMATAAVHVTRAAEATKRLSGERVLLMDDDPNALEALAEVVRDLGAEVRPCANEDEARAAIAEGFLPHLLMMDLRIDGRLNGVDITNRLRSQLSPPPPAIIVTGDTAADTLAFLGESGHQWLIKPVEPAMLMQAISRQLADATT
ncbi:MAG: CHASE3 domain-containing protein [Proteobacteria bacterium]|nr:CHASE3 domain-containing protein [Pseudomonadota bacterium]